MTILAIFSPGPINNAGGWGITAVTQFVANPFATPGNPGSTVWIQCTPAAMEYYFGDDVGDAAIGVLEIEFLDQNGQIQTSTFGDVNDVTNNLSLDGIMGLPTTLAVTGFLSMTVLLLGYNVTTSGSVTLFEWG
jgi:hypothetical protein